MKVRILSAGFETFTGSLGFKAVFKDGVSVDDMDARQVARIGSSLRIIDVETGLQVGPASVALAQQNRVMPVAEVLPTQDKVDDKAEDDRDRLTAEAKAVKDADDKALAEAKAKTAANPEDVVIYSRTELEAIGANDGIEGLREIATPLDVKARSISDMVKAILDAQAKLSVS